MNKKFLFKIPIKKEGAEGRNILLSINTLLYPYFISESALLSLFVEEHEYSKYKTKAREIIFNSSIRAEEYVACRLNGYPKDYVLLLKRELALCYAMNYFANHFHKGHYETLSRSKTYGEFSVSTTIKNSPYLLRTVLDNSKSCLEDIKKEIDDLAAIGDGLGYSNLKGSLNPGNPLTWRLWFHNNLPIRSSAIFASEKLWYRGNIYKDGEINTYVPDTRAEYRGRTQGPSIYNY